MYMLSASVVTLKTSRQTFKTVVVNVDNDFDERGPEGDCVDSRFQVCQIKKNKEGQIRQ